MRGNIFSVRRNIFSVRGNRFSARRNIINVRIFINNVEHFLRIPFFQALPACRDYVNDLLMAFSAPASLANREMQGICYNH